MDRLWAPWRMNYIKTAKEQTECIFCEAAKTKDDASRYVVHRGAKALIIMNLYPYNNGHLMVSPYRHIPNLTDMDDDEMLDVMKLLKMSVEVIKRTLNPEGFNIGVNIGRFAGAGIEDHIHFHIVPRWRGDTNFMTTLSNTRVLPETIDQTYKRLLEAKR
ncbi:MAG: HIT domain-containing protein [Candidatus Caldarchaeum sp.]|nr:HIT domain-containing protein [Candidatus Caldarchaeum sp.]MCS7129441.1 HIT domain-containing protein [Candidatus Caldarchaeum sp.]MDW7978394.1 HIT domain-containing protein [Candidatus Caldarchaeum sp.]MDW8359583.1 HIT domain-containing protein [Candidatus Caldarchaeum sp.]